jgi:tungstate transport system substrate-binding protein
VEGDTALLNIYHVITVNPEKYPNLNTEGAKAFAAFLVSEKGQEMISKFGVEKFGQPLFTPDAGKSEDELGK